MSESLFLQLLSPLAVAVLLGYLGKWVNETFLFTLHPWWERTLPAHPVVVGALIGTIPGMPPPPVEGAGLAGSIILYGTAGALAVPLYHLIRKKLEGK